MASATLPETKHTPGLVDRLYDRRGVCSDGFPSTFGDDLCREAAEEVLRLRAENERLREALRRVAARTRDYDTLSMIDLALDPEQTALARARAALSEQEGR